MFESDKSAERLSIPHPKYSGVSDAARKALSCADAAYDALALNGNTVQTNADKAFHAAYVAFHAAIVARDKDPGYHR